MVIKDGAKMSKSLGNVVSPDEMVARYGADAARLYSLFAAPPDRDLDWQDSGIAGIQRFLGKVHRLVTRNARSSTDASVETLPATSLSPSARQIHPSSARQAKALLEGKRLSAAQAWIKATEELAAQYQGIDDSYLRERAADVRDIARRVLRKMQGKELPVAIALERPAILLADELLPSEAAACDAATVLGVLRSLGVALPRTAQLFCGRSAFPWS